jgi:hypothetical protein
MTATERDYNRGFRYATTGQRPPTSASSDFWAGYEDGSQEMAA